MISSANIILTVTNSLNTDQRMQRICNSLSNAGYKVTLVGWELFDSPELKQQSFAQYRIRIYFQSGKLRYLEYNLKLFFYLIRNSFDIVNAVDLDTVLPGYWASLFKRKKMVYDAHEYFTELEEIVRRPLVKKVWKAIERFCLPRIKYGYAVNESYVKLFREQYNCDYKVVRNATVYRDFTIPEKKEKYILYQGAVNEGRAFYPLMQAMKQVDAPLIICGKGDFYLPLQQFVKENGLENKVIFKGALTPEELLPITQQASIGITLFENNGLSNYYSLANRYFDYLHNAVPQICCAFPEYVALNKNYEVAALVDDVQPTLIAEALNRLLTDDAYYNKLQSNCMTARKQLCWQQEEKVLLKLYEMAIDEIKTNRLPV